MAFLLMAPVKKKADITTKAEYIITLTWDDDSSDDIDLWIRDPIGNIIYFRDAKKGFMHIDRDDLGKSNDTIVMPNGVEVSIALNQEIATIRGFIPGEWIINIHMFRKWYEDSTNVVVKIEKLNPTVRTLIYKKYTMETHWEEITVARLTMTADGDIIDMEDELPVSLVNEMLGESDADSEAGSIY